MEEQIKKLKEVIEYLELADDELGGEMQREYLGDAHLAISEAIEALERI